MVRLAGFPAVPSWFVVLPDCDAAREVSDVLRHDVAQTIAHPSGRPWLLGRWADDAVTIGRAGDTAIALIGEHATTARQLTRAAENHHVVGDLDRLASSLVGSAHMVASVAGDVRVQGTVTGIRRLFHARIGVTCVADRADVLAHLLDASLDEHRLAVHLLEPPILYPLAGESVWRGVTTLPTDHYLVLDRAGRHRQVRWWHPPEPVVPMAEGARELREALSAAVAARVSGRPLISCDLGGVDSTAICCLAARVAPTVAAYTAASPDPLADDVAWAERTVARRDNIEHHVIPAGEMPLVYHGLLGVDDPLDEPCSFTVDRDRWMVIARQASARGSKLHLTGFGGDELLYGSVAHLHTMLRTHPRVAARHLRGFAAKYRWPRGRMLRQLADRRPYRAWLADVAGELRGPAIPASDQLLGWGFVPRLPPWITRDAAAVIADLIRNAARNAEPLARNPGQHRELDTMRFVSRIARQLAQMAAPLGLTFAAPYYDDRVIEAGLAVRPHERVTPWRYKPLIAEAMRGIVPDESLNRDTKANGTGDEEPGHRRHRGELMALWEDSRLARLGLIDADAVRDVTGGPVSPHLQAGVLYQTVACEVWLRALERADLPI
jgi:asparagine synthase (glutamine-hydrolysing)